VSNYEELLQVLKSRRSIRRFAERPVSHDDLQRVLEAARWAPSNHNRQPWRFLVVEDRRRIQTLAESVRQSLAVKLKSLPAVASAYAGELGQHATVFAGAPVLIVALHKRPVSVSAALLEGLAQPALVSGEPLSVAMAVQNLMLAAPTLGLGTCVLTAPLLVPEAIAGVLALPAGCDLTCFVALGYPAEAPEAPRRKSLEQIVEYRQSDPTIHDDRTGNL
jgi:coenzyme F420-0:L-glutamate ligase / coenzyme F420-1:gamma-L-glutamate ligase